MKNASVNGVQESMAKAAMAKRRIRNFNEYIAALIEEDYKRHS